MIIAIDGPAGAGKSTVAKRLAEKLDFLYIDTGAMYRALTLKALDTKIDIRDTKRLIDMARRSEIQLINEPDGSLKVLLDSSDVSKEIREPRITKHVSDLAKVKGVREIMLKLQRKLGRQNNSVLEGRDIGTVVFPKADLKFFLDADFKERVKRRYKDLKNLEIKRQTVKNVAADLKNRDTIDSTRKVAPLKKAKDAVYMDTTCLSINEVVEALIKETDRKIKLKHSKAKLA